MVINANNIVPEFRQAEMSYLVSNYPIGNLQYRNYFPLSFNPSLTFGNLESKGSAKVMADIVSIGAKAPRKGRDFVSAIKGEIPKIEIARDMNEKDLLTLQQLRQSVSLFPNNAGIKNELISKVYEDVPFCIDGVNARLEWMAKQLVSTGKFTTSVTNNAGGVSNVKLDFGVSVKNAVKDWFAATDADPITEIQDLQATARGNGYVYATITLERDTLNKLLNNAKVRAFVFGVPLNSSSVLPNVSLEQLNVMLIGAGLPSIVLWESFVSAELKTGNKSNVTGWEQGNILFSVDAQLGQTQYTTSTEFGMTFPDTITQAVNDNFILVKSFGVQDPIMISTKATAFALPVLNNTKKNVILKTKLA